MRPLDITDSLTWFLQEICRDWRILMMNILNLQPQIAAKSSPIFPGECIFCDLVEIKIAGKTERINKFTLKHAWGEIEEWAKEMENSILYRKVKETDLFAVEAQFYWSSRMEFTTVYHNYVTTIQRVQSHEDIDQSRKTAAHSQSFKLVLVIIATVNPNDMCDSREYTVPV